MKGRSLVSRRRHWGALVALALAAGAPTANAAPQLGGYRASATGEVLAFHPRLPGFTIVEEPFEATVGLSHARAATGGTTFARSSILWPGDIPANFGSLLAAAGAPVQIPNYPVRAEAREFDGERSAGIPGIAMRAKGTPEEAVAESSAVGVSLGATVQIGSATSISASRVTGGAVAGESIVQLSDVSLLNGLVTIESLVSRSEARSDAAAGAGAGQVVVTGLKVAGVPAVVDGNGVRARDQEATRTKAADEQIKAALARAGARLVVTGAEKGSAGADGSALGSGLLFAFKTVGYSSIPPCECSLVLASTRAHATATEAAAALDDQLPAVGGLDLASDGSGADPGPDTDLSPGLASLRAIEATDAPARQAIGGAPPRAARPFVPASRTAPLDYRYGGIPGWALALVLVAVAFTAPKLSRYVGRLVTPE